MGDREFDLIVFGATGFTGGLCVEYLIKTFGTDGLGLKWAIAGRSRPKLEKVLANAGKHAGDEIGASKVPLVMADLAVPNSLREMAKKTKVVLSTVGPFMVYGKMVVEACIKEGTDYCDSTGETTWIRRMLDEYEEEAKANGVRLVPSCGYDSLPSDLGALVLVSNIRKEKPNAQIGEVTNYVGPLDGGFSGGTAHTMVSILGQEEKRMLARVYLNSLVLVPKGMDGGKPYGDQRIVYYDRKAGVFTCPWIMSPGNERIVRRSAAFKKYGPAFRFIEVLAYRNPIKAVLMAIAINFGFLLAAIPPIRWLMVKFLLPSPGTGPSRKSMDKGYGLTTFLTEVEKSAYTVLCHIANGDVGYKSTSMMLSECAVAMARSRDHEECKRTKQGGFYTPATCPGLGLDLLDDLEKCGISFKFEKHDSLRAAQKVVRTFDSQL